MVLRSLPRFRHLLRRRYIRSLSSGAGAGDGGAFYSPSSSTTPPSVPSSGNRTPGKLFRFLKFGFFGAVAGVLGTAGYATYAYTADEVDDKTKAFRSSINHAMVDTAPTIQKFEPLYSTIMTVPAKAVDLYLSLRRLVEEHVQEFAEPSSDKLLPDMDPSVRQMGVLTLVLDLRDTLIHTEWKRETGWSTFKRPGLDAFLEHLSQLYEIVVYTDEMNVDHLREKFAQKGVCFMLARPGTKYQDGKHYRDLSKLNRDPSKILYVSGHALETCLQHENCVPIKPWRKEADDTTDRKSVV